LESFVTELEFELMTEPNPSIPEAPATEVAEVPVTPEVVEQISSHLGEGVTTEQVQTVLAAWNAVRQGAAVGTVLRDSVSGALAHRVEANGVQMWRCTGVDGTQWNDMQPTLPWDVVFDPSSVS
jgi:hypothetical protein